MPHPVLHTLLAEKVVSTAKELDASAYLTALLGGEAGLRRGEIAGL